MLPLVISGMTEASTTRSPSIPRTFRSPLLRPSHPHPCGRYPGVMDWRSSPVCEPQDPPGLSRRPPVLFLFTVDRELAGSSRSVQCPVPQSKTSISRERKRNLVDADGWYGSSSKGKMPPAIRVKHRGSAGESVWKTFLPGTRGGQHGTCGKEVGYRALHWSQGG